MILSELNMNAYFEEDSIVDSPIVVAISVFLSIYLTFLLIRLFADFFLVGIALGSAVLAYHIQEYYSEFLMVLQESNILSLLSLNLPPEQPDSWAIFTIAGIIAGGAVLISIPILPFSATYRQMLGVENPVFARKEAKVRAWIHEEMELYQQRQKNED